MFKKMEGDSSGSVKTLAPNVSSRTVTQSKVIPSNKEVIQAKSAPQTYENGVSLSKAEVKNSHVSEDVPDSHEVTEQDELPHARMARSLVAQWRNFEETNTEGRDRETKRLNTAKRSQSMSRVETAQRARVYANDRPPPVKSKRRRREF